MSGYVDGEDGTRIADPYDPYHDWPLVDWYTPRVVRFSMPRCLAECLDGQPELRDVGAGAFAVALGVWAA